MNRHLGKFESFLAVYLRDTNESSNSHRKGGLVALQTLDADSLNVANSSPFQDDAVVNYSQNVFSLGIKSGS